MGGLVVIASVPIGAKQKVKSVLWFCWLNWHCKKIIIIHCMIHIIEINIQHYHEKYCITIPGSHCECTHEFTSEIARVRGTQTYSSIHSRSVLLLLLRCRGHCPGNRRLICLFQQGVTRESFTLFKSPCYGRNGLNLTNAQLAVRSTHTFFMTVSYTVIVPALMFVFTLVG